MYYMVMMDVPCTKLVLQLAHDRAELYRSDAEILCTMPYNLYKTMKLYLYSANCRGFLPFVVVQRRNSPAAVEKESAAPGSWMWEARDVRGMLGRSLSVVVVHILHVCPARATCVSSDI